MSRLAVNVEQLRMLLISEINPYKTFLCFFLQRKQNEAANKFGRFLHGAMVTENTTVWQ